MPELTAKDSPVRLFVSEKHGRIVASHPDYLLVVCVVCGGTKSITLHKLPGQAEVPTVFACYCDKPTVIPTKSEEAFYAASLQ